MTNTKCTTCFGSRVVKTIKEPQFEVILVKCPTCSAKIIPSSLRSRPTQEIRITPK